MFNSFKNHQKEILLIIITATITGLAVNSFKKTELQIPYPPAHQLEQNFKTLSCEEISETYMRAWPKDSDLVGDASNSVQLSVHEEKLTKWESGSRDANGNIIDTSKVKKSTIELNVKDNKVMFTGDNLWQLENQPFDVTLNNQYRMAGALATSQETQPRYDMAGNFMLDKNTSFLILSDTDTMITQNESFGTRSRLFSCKKVE